MSLRPRVLHRCGRTTLRFTLSAPARVKVSTGRRARMVRGHRGVNRLGLRPHGLAVGRHRLVVRVAGGRARSIGFRVVR